MAPFHLLRIDHIVLRVADLDRSLAFYVGALGCTVEKRQEAIGLIQLRAGDSLIDLVPVTGKLGRAGGGARSASAATWTTSPWRSPPSTKPRSAPISRRGTFR